MSAQLLESLGRALGAAVPTAGVPPTGRYALPQEVADAEVILCLGTRVVGTERQRKIFWPLNVAPVDASVNRLPYTSARNRARQAVLRKTLGLAVSRADGFVFGSHYARSIYMARYATGARLPYVVVPNGPPSLAGLARAEFISGGRGPFQILCCSHLDAYKGILELVEAVALLPAPVRERIHVRLAGADREPAYAVEVRRRIRSYGLDHQFDVGPVQGRALAAVYENADLFVFPSVCENAGSLSLFDALHAGVATICSDRSSMPEITRGATSLVNPYDPAALAQRMEEVILSDDLRRGLAERAIAWSEAAPTWDDRADTVLDFVNREVLG